MTRPVSTVQILTNAIAISTGTAHEPRSVHRTFHAKGQTSAGAGAATILIEASNDNTAFFTIGTITLTLSTTTTGDGFTTEAPWRYVRARVPAISGTDATVSVIMGNVV